MLTEVRTATVEQAETPAPHVRTLILRLDNPDFSFVPGQWISLRLPVGNKPPLIRAYSLAAPPAPGGTLELCFDRVESGAASEYLWSLAPGDTVSFSGPLGNFTLPEGDNDLVFVARYTGIVPFRAMLMALDNGAAPPGRRVHLVYRVPTLSDLVYHSEFVDLAARAPWFDYHPLVDGTRETDLLAQRARQWMPFTPMVCGVRDLTAVVRALFVEQLGFERRAVKVENYNGPTAPAETPSRGG